MDYWYLILVVPTIIIALFAQIKVKSSFNKFSRVNSSIGMTAADVTRKILDSNGLHNVSIQRVRGNLTDHYDPRTNVIRLSDSVYNSTSIAAIGVAAHEAGHAIQHAEGYQPIKMRKKLVPVTTFVSRFSWIMNIGGFLFMCLDGGYMGYYISLFGIGLFAFTTLFQLVTLPCEFNASSRALSALDASGYYSSDELSAAKKVLSAAALTYVASFALSLLQLLRLLAGVNRRR
jgi:Zn-dependent membrane protease YugP